VLNINTAEAEQFARAVVKVITAQMCPAKMRGADLQGLPVFMPKATRRIASAISWQ